MKVKIELERETDGRWIAEARSMGVLLYGATRRDAVERAKQATFAALAGSILSGEERAPRSVVFEVTVAGKHNGLAKLLEVFSP